MAVVGMMVMELSVIIPWFRSLTPDTLAIPPVQAMLILGIVMEASHIIARSMNYLFVKINLQRSIFLVYLFLAVLIGLRYLLYETERVGIFDLIYRPIQAFTDWRTFIPPELIIVLTVFLTTWRGISLAQKYIEPISVKKDFLIGVMALILFAFINTAVTGETPGGFMYLFLSAGLFSMASSRIYSISHLRGGTKNPFDLKWFFGLSLTVFSVITVSTLLVWLLSNRLAIIQGIGGLILGFFALILLVFSSPLFYLAQQLAEGSPGISDSIGRLLESLSSFREMISGFSQRILTTEQLSFLFSLISTIKPLLLWVLVGVVLIVLLSVIRRWKLREREISAEIDETMSLSVDFLGLIRNFLDASLQKIKDGLNSEARIRSERVQLVAARIRRIYTQLMNLAAELGAPRSKSQTPLEFLPILTSLFPQYQDYLLKITEAYLKVRYGELAETEEEIRTIEDAWREIETAGQLLLKHSSRKGENR